MRIAYCLLVHKNLPQVSRLMDRIYSPEDSFYIQAFRTAEAPSFSSWANLAERYGRNVVVKSKHGPSRARFGLVDATLQAMDWSSECSYSYFVNLSGQCYPVKRIAEIKQELAKESLAYLENFELPYENWGGSERIDFYRFTVGPWTIRVPRMTKRLPYDLRPYGGSQWFCLPRRFVDFVLSFVSEKPRIIDFYRHSFIPDEMFFHTIIMNSALRCSVVNDNKRYIDWSEDLAHPKILTSSDLPRLLLSGKWFARKFDTAVDATVLDLIDERVFKNAIS